MEKYLEKAQELFIDYAPKVVTALAILIAGDAGGGGAGAGAATVAASKQKPKQ